MFEIPSIRCGQGAFYQVMLSIENANFTFELWFDTFVTDNARERAK